MKYLWKRPEYRRGSKTRFSVGKILFCGIVILASATCRACPLVHVPTVLAISLVSCVNPTLPNSEITATPVPAIPGIVVINEVLTSPHSVWTCTNPTNTSNQEDPWIEIYNPQDQALDLYAAHAGIYEEQNIREMYYLPFGSIIAAHGFLVVFPFTNLSSDVLAQMSSVYLCISQVVVDQIAIPTLAAQTSYARTPDGSNTWQATTTPTIASSNTPPGNQPATATGQTGKSTGTKNRTTRQKSTHTQSGTTSHDESIASTGVQPTWSALRLPSSASNDAAHSTALSPAPPTTPAGSFELPKQILFPLLIGICLVTILWGWRFYRGRNNIRP